MSQTDHHPGRWRVGRWVLPALGLLTVVLAGASLAQPQWPARRGGWLMQGVLSGQFLFCAAVLLGCGILLAALCLVMWRLGRFERQRPRGQEGTVLLEFALILPLALMLVLVMAQATLLMAGNLCVHYSAFCAARSAVTMIPLNQGNEQPNAVVYDNTPDKSLSPKQRRILQATLYAVMPVSCGNQDIPDRRIVLQDALGQFFQSTNSPLPFWVDAQLGRKWQYAMDHTAVELVQAPPDLNTPLANWLGHAPTVAPPPEVAGMDYYSKNEDVTVRVTHTFYLAVPYAARLFAFGSDGRELQLGGGGKEFGTIIRATCTLTNEGVQDYVDVEVFPQRVGQ